MSAHECTHPNCETHGKSRCDGIGCDGLAVDSATVVLPTPERAEVGSLFVCADGTAYRLRSYSADWKAEPFTGEHTKPSYSVLLPGGASTNAGALPADARLVWAPSVTGGDFR